ncbi:hypothetical protein FXO38_16435 [Capsicum annuum]|nr:hypothetical protein FXO37_20152 [Capsicum annuum]KAF3651793.1 hypothetical protein FXO38_16435 [Capsicum annuum]
MEIIEVADPQHEKQKQKTNKSEDKEKELSDDQQKINKEMKDEESSTGGQDSYNKEVEHVNKKYMIQADKEEENNVEEEEEDMQENISEVGAKRDLSPRHVIDLRAERRNNKVKPNASK